MESSSSSSINLFQLAELIKKDSKGIVSASIENIGEMRVALVTKWKYRELMIKDESMNCTLQMGDDKFSALKSKVNDNVLFYVKSRGTDNDGKLAVIFQREATPSEAATITASLLQQLSSVKNAKKKVRSGPTVWQFHAREARGLILLVRFYLQEKLPQHYHKFSLDQFVAEDLYGAGWAKRVGRGLYIPTDDAISKIRTNSKFPNSRIKIITPTSVDFQDSPSATYRTIEEYLDFEADAETAKAEFKEAMRSIEQT